MNSSMIILFAAFFCFSAVAADRISKNKIVIEARRTDPKYLKKIRGLQQKVRNKGCEINLCFAIDGSGSVTPEQFQNQKDFSDLIVNIITTDDPGNFAAVQYGTRLRSISPLTFKKNKFVRKLFRSKQVGGLSNIAGALGYCGFQLRPRIEDANKIIILGDGFDSIGFRPRVVAQRVLAENIDICAVSVGPSDIDGLNAITGDPGRVVKLDGFFELAEVVIGVVNDACGYSS